MWTLIGNFGLRFSRYPFRSQKWSAIIWDLITVTGKALIKIDKNVKKRAQGVNYLMTIINKFNPLDNHHDYSIVLDERENGLPIMLIIVQDKEIKI